LIDDGQHPKWTTAFQAISHEVHRPFLVALGGCVSRSTLRRWSVSVASWCASAGPIRDRADKRISFLPATLALEQYRQARIAKASSHHSQIYQSHFQGDVFLSAASIIET
jgi:hypothetical protein